jgi:predicted 3-demethylubiquinone-9 3-methyltransferase (glyoxalase superfamily)
MSKITPCLWYDGTAEEAARFYITLFPDSGIDRVVRSPADNPSMKEGGVLVVEFHLAGQPYVGLNGGPQFKFNESVSFMIECKDQAEVDRLWDTLTANGGQPSMCGWLKDRWGLSWQVIPKRMNELLRDPDPGRARRAMEAMLRMQKLDVATLERAADGR